MQEGLIGNNTWTDSDWKAIHHNSEGEVVGTLRVTKKENGSVAMVGPNIWGDVTFSVQEWESLVQWWMRSNIHE